MPTSQLLPEGAAQEEPPNELSRVTRHLQVYGEGSKKCTHFNVWTSPSTPGFLLAIMGASGSGKSTLLTIAGSLEEPTTARCTSVAGALSSLSRERQGSAAAPIHRLCIPGLQPVGRTQRGGERVPAARAGWDRCPQSPVGGAGLARSSDWRIGVYINPDQLSGGECLRVRDRPCRGQAPAPPGLLLFRAHFYSTNAEEVMRLILAACHRGMAAVVVTEPHEPASWADRVIFLATVGVVGRDAAESRARKRCSPISRTNERRRSHRPAIDLSLKVAARPPVAYQPGGRRAAPAWRLFRGEWRQQLTDPAPRHRRRCCSGGRIYRRG